MSVRRVRFAKNGQKEELLEVKEEPETAEQALGKATSSSSKKGNKQKQALEKATVVPEEGKKEHVVPEEGKKEHVVPEEGKKEQALEKAPVVPEEGKKKEALEKAPVVPEEGNKKEALEKAPVVPDGITLVPALEKASSSVVPEPKASGITLKPAPFKKRVVVVDWHDSLEKEDQVPLLHQQALEKLMDHAEVHLLSYVASTKREIQVHQDVRDMVKAMHRLAGVHTTWSKVGWQGKAAWCKWLNAEAIFDDDEKICRECFGKGIQTFALMSGRSSHNYLPARVVFKDFPEAVDEYIDGLT